MEAGRHSDPAPGSGGVWDNSHPMGILIRIALCAPLAALALLAEVSLPALFGDHMVVQRDAPVHVWGSAASGEAVTAQFRGQTVSGTATAEGRWDVYLPPGSAGGPFTLTVSGGNTVRLDDVMVGEVWVASGQSNMVWPVSRSRDAEAEIQAANHAGIRYFKVELATAEGRQHDVKGEWKVLTPATAGEFSGVGYFFARDLHSRLGVPFGIVQSAWGGTPVEAWTSARTFSDEAALSRLAADFAAQAERARPEYEATLAKWEQRAKAAKAAGQETPRKPRAPRPLQPHHRPSSLFNAMISPLVPYAIRGAIWYQGENNASRGQGRLYRAMFRALIEDWRREWGQGDFPFLFVQLANYGRVPEGATWAELRESQAKALGLANTGMAVTIDIGNPTDIHPRNKQDVGLRLALAARSVTYGERDLSHSGPTFRQATREEGALRLWFDHVGDGLEARGGALAGFEVAGSDGRFVAARAEISGAAVVVSSPEVETPLQARYAWAAAPEASLFNAAGLPASPFRTMD